MGFRQIKQEDKRSDYGKDFLYYGKSVLPAQNDTPAPAFPLLSSVWWYIKSVLKEDGKVIESRTYETVYGPWTYFTADDGQIADDEKNYLGIGTLESYIQLKNPVRLSEISGTFPHIWEFFAVLLWRLLSLNALHPPLLYK